jgi:carboxypeptidase Taq
MNKNYEQLKAHSKKIETLNSIQAILGWDQETFMPPGAEEFRSEQVLTLAGMFHAEQTSP